jgi:hypothetical protein
MKLNKFLKLFDGLNPDTEISIPELRIVGSEIPQLSKLDLNLELFRVKDKQYEKNKERIVNQNSLFFALIIVLVIICGVQLGMILIGIC